MHSLCDFAFGDAKEILMKSGNPNWEEDWRFLGKQRKTLQIGSIQGVDRTLMMKESKNLQQEQSLEARKQKESLRQTSSTPVVLELEECEDTVQTEPDSDSSFEELNWPSSRPASTTLELPTKYLVKKSALVAHRFGISG